jgi:glycine betaine/proline transport system substrate-binding protein
VRESQARRWVVYEALRNGAYFPWDYQPLRASERYMRNHMDLNVLEGSKRFPARRIDGKIYGIEAGSGGNKGLLAMIEDKSLAGFELIESSEAGMLTQAEQMMKDKGWVVFLGWTPHPVMGEMKINYITGLEKAGFGEAKVYTLTRKGYSAECPNAATFVKNLKFTLSMENAMMAKVLAGENPNDVAKEWLKANPDAITPWLAGVTTFDGQDAAAAAKAALAN